MGRSSVELEDRTGGGPAVAAPEAAAPAPPAGRVVSIDILRGLAILWVIVFHLHVDMTYRNDAPEFYARFRDQLFNGHPLPALTAFGELILGQGYLGVVAFMILSGMSLTMNAYWRGEPAVLRGYWTRFRRILPVYWAGVLLILATVAMVALLQMLVDGGSYEEQWFNVRIAAVAKEQILWNDVAWALSVFPWIFREKFGTPPVASLWFVELLLQYYLLFPFALLLLKKIGPWYFAGAGIAFTLAARAVFVPLAFESMQPFYVGRNLGMLSAFRGSEFFLGMSIGYLLACRRDDVSRWVRSPVDVVGLVAIGALCITGGVVLAPWNKTYLVFGDVVVQVGLALFMLPLLFKRPGRTEANMVSRALIFLGVVSFTALIVNDMMRYFASFIRFEGYAEGPAWWFFLVVVYVPVGTLLAYPLAGVFGLLPRQRAKARAVTAAAHSPAY